MWFHLSEIQLDCIQNSYSTSAFSLLACNCLIFQSCWGNFDFHVHSFLAWAKPYSCFKTQPSTTPSRNSSKIHLLPFAPSLLRCLSVCSLRILGTSLSLPLSQQGDDAYTLVSLGSDPLRVRGSILGIFLSPGASTVHGAELELNKCLLNFMNYFELLIPI